MIRPRNITVCGVPFNIEWDSQMVEAGLVNFDTCQIEINGKLNHQLQCDTLIHETLHVIWYFYNLGTKEKEERAVSCIATGLNSVFANNPKFLKFIEGVHKEGEI